DGNRAFDFNSGSDPDITAITQIGMALSFANSGRNLESTWVDVIRYGDGLTITSGVSDAVDMESIYADQHADIDGRALGIIRKEAGVYMVQGKLRFGSLAALSCDFDDISKVIVFEDLEVAADLYEIIVQGNGTGTTNLVIGNKSGGRGIQGFVFRSEGVEKYDFVATDEDIAVLQLYGCTFFDADTVSLPLYDSGTPTNREMLDATFEGCGVVIPQTFVVKYCNFVNSDAEALRLASTSHNVDNCAFIGCPIGIQITVAGTYTFTNMV
ncbi:unnamed protein product, partial [marine sediment metagenome]